VAVRSKIIRSKSFDQDHVRLRMYPSQKRPTIYQKSPIIYQKSPMIYQKSPRMRGSASPLPISESDKMLPCGAVWCGVVRCGAVWCGVMHCVAVGCSVSQCVAVCCRSSCLMPTLELRENSLTWPRITASSRGAV